MDKPTIKRTTHIFVAFILWCFKIFNPSLSWKDLLNMHALMFIQLHPLDTVKHPRAANVLSLFP